MPFFWKHILPTGECLLIPALQKKYKLVLESLMWPSVCLASHILLYPLVCTLSCFSRVRLCNPMDHSLPGSSVQGILQARILEWVVIFYARGSPWPKDRAHVSYIICTGRQVLYHQHHPWSPSMCTLLQYQHAEFCLASSAKRLSWAERLSFSLRAKGEH